MTKFTDLTKEDAYHREDCNLCKETSLNVSKKTPYDSIIIYKIGSYENGWFATLSPKTGGNPKKDFTIQLMPIAHLTHFSQIDSYSELAKNYGIAFSKLSKAITQLMVEENPKFNPISESKEDAVSVAVYGKCTNWKEKKEHLHIKLFPFKGNIGQPYTVDSSFERKKTYKDEKTGEEFVKMNPIKKINLEKERLEKLSSSLISLLKCKRQ